MAEKNEPYATIESAWEMETQTLRQTIRIYMQPAKPLYKPRASRAGKVKVLSSNEIPQEELMDYLNKHVSTRKE